VKIRSLKLKDERFGNQWAEEVQDRWGYRDFLADRRWREGWISVDCVLYDAAGDRVYMGVTSFDADIFKAYDRRTGRFVDLGYDRVADPFDAKFHRSLVKGPDDCIYGAVALLHDPDRFLDAPGGAVVRYDPRSGDIAKLCVPLPHVYIQSVALDAGRRRVYCLCFAPEKLACVELDTGRVIDYGLIGTGHGGMAQGENICLDDDGCVWSNWMLTRAWQSGAGPNSARLCKIDPQTDRIVFYDSGLPNPDGSGGTVKAEALLNFHDGWLYATGGNGSIYRIDPQTGEATYLFTPIPDRRSRLASMTVAGDGCAYGATGRDGRCELLRLDFRNDAYELLGEIVAEDGEPCWQVHDICMAADGVLYAGENDNPYRSGYLWEIAPD